MFIDTHTHLAHSKFEEDPAQSVEERISAATAAGVTHLIHIACHPSEWEEGVNLIKTYPQVSLVAGIHPHDAAAQPLPPALNTLQTLIPHLVGIGETGLDYFYNNSPVPDQKESFHAHLELAKSAGLPTVIHTRDAEADTIEILKQHAGAPFVLHCFSGTRWLAEEALALGGYLSFSGILTFNKAQEIQEVAKLCPRDKALLETDAPYLAPSPHRGKRNEPAFLPNTAKKLADLWGSDVAEVAQITTANAHKLFTKLPSGV
ncbi:MAG: LuxR family transcriptional regulator [Alphaproteobacteria bacterium CG_4_10_14_0_8_um_filter_53_9]|nr:MAG: LuxR family transcriptional regulator [Alphaproteobacteria bacterium CG_4_10_14_0_8_um_filter_53_9]